MDIFEPLSSSENTLIDVEQNLENFNNSFNVSSEEDTDRLLTFDNVELTTKPSLDLEITSNDSQVNQERSDPLTGIDDPETFEENSNNSDQVSDEIEVEPSEFNFESGVFTVREEGLIDIDFLFDGGKHKGELAIFSLEDLNEEPGSEAFIKEAASRALSRSEQGYIVISDSEEGSRFSGVLGEHENENWNRGEHQDGKTFAMNPGDEFGILFVPNGKVQEVYNDPSLEGSKRPLFSMTTANPDDIFEEGLITDLTGDAHTFVMEDAWGPDYDYNDFIFQMQGAIGNVVVIDDVIDPEKDWRETDLGTALLDYVTYDPTNPTSIQVSDTVSYALERAANLEQYDPEALTETQEWVVGISETLSADSVALLLDVENLGETGILENTYIFKFSDQETSQEIGERLENLPGLEFAYPLVPLPITSSFVPNDPLFEDQWHLQNTGQTGGTIGADANIETAWDLVKGNEVVIGVVDDGLQHTHPDLASQYRADLSRDFVDGDSEPLSLVDSHGTAVAGIAAANGNNSQGVTGSAPSAELAGLRLFSDFSLTGVTDLDASTALIHESQAIDIYNNSWGFNFWDPILTPSMPLTLAALEQGVNEGRDGLGNIYVWSAGNSQQITDDVNYFGLANSRYTIAVSAIDHNGEQSWYSEPGSPVLVAAHSSGDGVGTTTTDLLGIDGYNDGSNDTNYTDIDYTNSFGGTSSAAPLVSGIVALMLDANPNLTWRDVQHILVDIASQNDPTDADWATNGAGHLVNHKYGFGAIDADAAVSAALSWTNVAPENLTSSFTNVEQEIPDNNTTGLSSTISITDDIDVEWVEVVFDADHAFRGDLEITLTSPDGTESILAETRNDYGSDYQNWVFTSARNWDESSLGDWTLKVTDLSDGDIGTWNSWQLNVYGTGSVASVPVVSVSVPDSQASEDNDSGSFTITRTGETSEALDVNYSVSGSAENGIDYEQLSGTVTILPGDTSAVITIDPIDDNFIENNESVTLSLDADTDYQLGADVNGTVTIADNDTNLVDLSSSYFNVPSEPLDTGEFFTTEFAISNSQTGNSGAFYVDFYISDNSTISTSDYYLGSYYVSDVLGNSSTGTLTKTLSLPSWEDPFWDGNVNGAEFYIGMIVDADNNVDETNESNNQNNELLNSYDDVPIDRILVGSWSSAGYEDFKQQIQQRWNQGHELWDVEYGDGRWFGVFGEDTRRNAWSSAGYEDFKQQIQDRWDQGFNLIDVGYGDGRWFGVFAEDSGRNAWSYSTSFDTFTQQIQDRWDNQGYELISVEYGDGRWFGVFGDDDRPNAYSFSDDINTFTQQISDKRNEGLDLIDVEYGNGTWFGIFRPDDGLNTWSYAGDFEVFKQQIRDRWDQGFEFVDVGYGNGTWFGVFQD